MKPTIQEKIEHDRREKWRRFRERNNMAADAPFAGKHPLLEAYEEALDAIHYLEEAERQIKQPPAHVGGALISIRIAAGHAQLLARFVLGAIEALRERGAWEEDAE
jgi:hypothetical protein